MTRPTISTILTMYRHPVHMAVAAVQSVLDQTIPPDEVIVVLDGPPREDESVVNEAFGDRVMTSWREHEGIAGARNAGIALSSGEVLTFLDSDDLWVRNKMELQLAALDLDSALEAVYGRADQFYDESVDDEFRRRYLVPDGSMEARMSTAKMIRRDSFDRIGPFDSELDGGIDVEWHSRALDRGLRFAVLPEVVFHRRIHPHNNSIVQQKQSNQHRLAAVVKHLEMTRARSGSTKKEHQ